MLSIKGTFTEKLEYLNRDVQHLTMLFSSRLP